MIYPFFKSINWRVLAFLITSLTILNACQSDIQECAKPEHQLLTYELQKSYVIPVDTLQYNYDGFVPITTDRTNTLLAAYDPGSHRINYFSLENQNYSHFTQLYKDDHNAVAEPASIYYHNRDSIFISRGGYFSIYLVNDKGIKINEWEFLDVQLPDSLKDKTLSPYFSIGGFDRYGMRLKYLPDTKEIVGHFHVIPNDGDNNFPYTYRAPIAARFDITSGRLKKVTGKFPDRYLKKNIPHDLFFPLEVFQNNVLVSFSSSHQMFSEENEYQLSCIPSKLIDLDNVRLYNKNDGGSVDDFWKGQVTNPGYVNIVADSHRGLIYRIAKHAQQEKSVDGKLNNKLQAKWSIVVFNDGMEVLGEVVFEAEKYNFMQVYALPEGILLSKNNTYRDDFNEDLMEFDLIKINYDQ